MNKDENSKRRVTAIVLIYPLGLVLIGILLNSFLFGVQPAVVALPTIDSVFALVVAAILLLINHTWLMTTTELTRVKFNMFATPEEWAASGVSREEASELGLRELERRHNAHRNATENTVYFVFLAMVFVLITPSIHASMIWIIGYAVARLGYTFSYLSGRDGVRGLFMSLSLLALYGMASYLAISFMV